LKIDGFCDFQLHHSHIGEGLVRVDVSFSSLLCAKEKDITLQGLPLQILTTSWSQDFSPSPHAQS
jgi:hypothetical protein